MANVDAARTAGLATVQWHAEEGQAALIGALVEHGVVLDGLPGQP